MPVSTKQVIPATQLRDGETFSYGGKTYVAHQATTKQRYVHVTIDAEANKIRVPIDHQVEVTRNVPTDDEVAEAAYRQSLTYCQRALVASYERVEKQKQKLIDDLDMQPSWTVALWVELATARAECAIWRRVQFLAATSDVDLVAAVRVVAVEVRDRIVENTQLLSRSTAPASNLAEDVEREAQARWLRLIKYRVHDVA